MGNMITVTQLVDFSRCEKMAILKRTRKEILNEKRQIAIHHGLREHAHFERQTVVDGRCFVSSFAFGPHADETQKLRAFRDDVLKQYGVGRGLIHIYYKMSPACVKVLYRIKWGKKIAQCMIRIGAKIFRVELDH